MMINNTSLVLQLSAGKGPDECARAVALAFRRIQHECNQQGLVVEVLESQAGGVAISYQHILLSVSGHNAGKYVENWKGSMLWQNSSPFRLRHKRKNWYFSGEVFCVDAENDELKSQDVEFSSCRASGAGGQHVNTTDSAVRAKHRPSGLTVRVESQRSQHANKKLALTLLACKLRQQKEHNAENKKQLQWQQHQRLERGNPQRIFKGDRFIE